MKSMKSKQMSKSAPPFMKGGNGKMAGKGSAGPQQAGQTTSAGKGGGKFIAGGKGKMAGKGSAMPAPSGKTAR